MAKDKEMAGDPGGNLDQAAVQELVETRLAEFRDEIVNAVAAQLPAIVAGVVEDQLKGREPGNPAEDAITMRLARQQKAEKCVILFKSGCVVRNRAIGIPNVPAFMSRRQAIHATTAVAEDLIGEGISPESFEVLTPQQYEARTRQARKAAAGE